MMTYEDQLAIGANLNAAIERGLRESVGEADPAQVAAVAQAVLVQLDQAGYKIVRK